MVEQMAETVAGPPFCHPTSLDTHGAGLTFHGDEGPGAISEQKQMVRGVERWYVDFDKCIPAFTELSGSSICIAECPWTRPSIRPKLLVTMARRLAQTPGES